MERIAYAAQGGQAPVPWIDPRSGNSVARPGITARSVPESRPDPSTLPDTDPRTVWFVLPAGDAMSVHRHPGRAIVFLVIDSRTALTVARRCIDVIRAINRASHEPSKRARPRGAPGRTGGEGLSLWEGATDGVGVKRSAADNQ